MGRRYLGAVLLLLTAAAAQADPAPPDLHGIALGMTPDKVSTSAHLPCLTPQYTSDLDCKDTNDGSDYRVLFSAGDPSIALSVQRSFCSPAPPDGVLKEALLTLHAPVGGAHGDPNGYTIELGNDNEAVLNADAGTCPSGGKHYVLLIRSNGLIKMSSEKAIQRAKAALH